jgi:hypothetical protein
MKTNDLITSLSRDLKPTTSLHGLAGFLLRWVGSAVLVVFAFGLLLPMSADLDGAKAEMFLSRSFQLEEFLWLALTVLSATIVYRSRIPSLKTDAQIGAAIGVAALLVTTVILRSTDQWASWNSFFSEARQEMSLYRGRCGFVIAMIGFAWSAILGYFNSNGAPTQPGKMGLWVAVSSGSIVSFAMPVVCAHENSLHILLWHCLPVALLAGLGFLAGRKLLAW